MRQVASWSDRSGVTYKHYFPDHEQARHFAKRVAGDNPGVSVYVGSVDSDPRDLERWCFDSRFGQAVQFACND